ncbi:hypothetical protein ACUXHY_004442 [Cytobacillus horneckiae]|nr:hypothetical protein [Cytobacillus horneckiae]
MVQLTISGGEGKPPLIEASLYRYVLSKAIKETLTIVEQFV